jgi:hypothetical protein
MFGQIEFVESVNEAEDTGVNQILEGNVTRQSLMNSSRDIANLWKLFHEDAFPFCIAPNGFTGCGSALGHKTRLPYGCAKG